MKLIGSEHARKALKKAEKPCTSDFAEAGPFNEMVVMGVLKESDCNR
jgi:hypothetical protein